MPDLRGIQKRFGGVHASKGVDFSLAAGEVQVLLGENRADRSTPMGVLSGAVVPDAGTIARDGKAVGFAGPRDAHAAGIAMIPQALDLAGKILIDCATEVPCNVLVPTQRIDQSNAKEMYGKEQFRAARTPARPRPRGDERIWP